MLFQRLLLIFVIFVVVPCRRSMRETLSNSGPCSMHIIQGVRGLGFKFVDFLYKSSDVCHTEIKMI